jgi:hypothetical protein
MSFNVKFSALNRGEAYDELASAEGVPTSVRHLLHEVIGSVRGDAAMEIEASGDFNGVGGSIAASVKVTGPAKETILTRDQRIKMKEQGRALT